ncbi:MAG: hypothetical protein HC840_05325 [Leptolyngbyaceae cyanobacterium RM2_2_4]|nr:hypothetical protein [Leptolyngbyaceae cyanobacterium SM1_4_3]NJN91696.1 hypothetical protein [Leptolyngbyaceae cyanobacterium SL_5_14]NJO48982.1 hypothetical protein [Leptolyngbyaceae cyanobacterium RM2_2_4]
MLLDSTISSRNRPDINLEFCVRNALATGELSPATSAYVRQVRDMSNLTRRDRTLLAILQDAIQEGCVQPIEPQSSTQSAV